eukprot:15450948-Alexandrium_andersonii.AAC.1
MAQRGRAVNLKSHRPAPNIQLRVCVSARATRLHFRIVNRSRNTFSRCAETFENEHSKKYGLRAT